MGFLKNRAIKAVTKKRANKLLELINAKVNSVMEEVYTNDKFDMSNPQQINEELKDTLITYIAVVEAGVPDGPKSKMGLSNEFIEEGHNWQELFVFITCEAVKAELAYDPSMGADEDYEIIADTATKELNRYIRYLKKF
jgi:hypothetical protein